MNNKGNRNTTGDIMEMFAALKENIMRSLKVCEVGEIMDGPDNKHYYKVKLLNKPETIIECFCLDSINKHSLVAILFTNYDTRLNLDRALNDKETNEVNIEDLKHSIDYGIIIKTIKEKESEE